MEKVIRKNNLVHKLFAAVYFVSAVLSAIPWKSASKECRLGYKALCSFTPYSTLILIVLLALHMGLAMKKTQVKRISK